MKRTLLTLAALAMMLTGMANPIGKQAALTVAKNFMKEVNPTAVLQTAAVRHAPGLNNTGETQPYYVFNAENNKGFVIIAGDDRSEEVLGYSDEGSFDSDNVPEALAEMLKGFVEDLCALDSLGLTEPIISANKAPRKAVSLARRPVAPLLKSLWDQGPPWWNFTPTYYDEDGKLHHGYVGCLGTAMTQIIYFWKYLNIPEDGIPAYTDHGDIEGGTKPALPYKEFDFSKLYDTYPTNSSDTYIVEFQRYISYGLRTSFSKAGGTVNRAGMPTNIRKFFGYEHQGFVLMSKCGAAEFENYVYNDLQQGYPVWVAGKSNPGRHSFVLDGYSFEDFFHVNWGWSGMGNGYFRLAPLNSWNTSHPMSWGNHLYGMFGIRPNDGNHADYKAYVPNEIASADLQSLYFTDAEGNNVTAAQTSTTEFTLPLTTYLDNWSNTIGSSYSRSFDVELTVFNANMNIVGHIKPDDTNVKIKQANILPVNYTLGSKLHKMNLPDGEYKLVSRSRVAGQNIYYFDRAKGKYAYVKMVKAGSKITLSLVETYTITGSEIIGQIRSGYKPTLRVHFTSNSFSKVEHTLTLYKDGQTNTGVCEVRMLDLAPMCSGYLDFGFFADEDTKQHTLYLVNKDWTSTFDLDDNIQTGTRILSKKYTSNTGDAVTPNLKFNWYAENAPGDTERKYNYDTWSYEYTPIIYGNEMHGYVEIENHGSEDYSDMFTAQVYVGNSYYNNGYKYVSTTKALTIPAGGSAKIDLADIDYSDLYDVYKKGFSNGYTISFSLYDGTRYNQENSDLSPIDTHEWIFRTAAYLWWDKNGKMTATTSMSSIPENAVAVSFISKNPSKKLDPNSNRNTIYYFSSTNNARNYLNDYTNRNVVTGSLTGAKTAANAVVFIDEKDAYVPYGFTAQKGVSYTRNFEYGSERNGGSGWTTICLPFKVESIKNGNTVIDWFHSYTDRNKNFWVNQFYGEDFMTSLYNYTDEIAANTPYILAMPGDSWGEQWSLTNKNITFSAGANAKVCGGYNIDDGMAILDAANQNFVSAAVAYREIQKGKTVYSMENPGNDFIYVSNPNLKSFRGYITKETPASMANIQSIAVINLGENEFDGGETDGIRLIDNSQFTIDNNVVYDLQGRVVSTTGLKALPKGMYIMNGKKFVIK